MTRRTVLSLVALASLVASPGCALGGSARVGGAPTPEVVELTLVTPVGSQEAAPFAEKVFELSSGTLRIRVASDQHAGPDYDAATIRDVQDGKADLGLVGTRAWDEFGVPGPTAIGAPFLVDSYELQERLFSGDLVDTMLEDMDRAGVQGIGIVPGPIRRPLGLSGPLAAPDDFAGLAIGTQQSSVADATLRALGAQPKRLPLNVTAGAGLSGLAGLELQVTEIESTGADTAGGHLMTNVNLWPRSLVVFAGANAYDRLTPDQRSILRDAARQVAGDTSPSEGGLEIESADNLCRRDNLVFDSATPQQLRELRRAVEPVYAELERDPETRRIVEAIERVKEDLAEPPTVIAPCTPPSDAPASGEPSEVDGEWTMDTVREDATPEFFDENWGHWVFVLSRGRFAITQENETSCTWGYGTFAVNGNRMAWTFLDGGGIAPNHANNRAGEYFVYDFSHYRDTLALSPVAGEVSPTNFYVHPWRLQSASAPFDGLSDRCPPPAQALGARD